MQHKPSKLEHTLTELHKIKNQIRVELNQVRYSREQAYPNRYAHASKRTFQEKSAKTSLLGREENLDLSTKVPTKKVFDKNNITNSNFHRLTERRHYQQNFADKVELGLSTRKKESCYLRNKTEAGHCSVSPIKYEHSTSLIGLGSNDKSPAKGGKRIIQNYHVFKHDLI